MLSCRAEDGLTEEQESLSLSRWQDSEKRPADMVRNLSMAKTLVFCFVCSVIIPSTLLDL